MKKKTQPRPNLKRQHRVMIRFNDSEIKRFRGDATRASLSQAEYGRRKCLNVPIADTTQSSDR